MSGKSRYRALVVAASTGGIDALLRLLAGIPQGWSLSIVIVLHTASDTAVALCEILQPACALPVREAAMGEPVLPGTVYLAPPGYHLLVERDEHFSLSVDEKVCFVRPSADVLFESAAAVWGRRLIGLVLTGANDDGARGLKMLRDYGGLGIVQAPDDAQMPTMPKAAIKIAGADHVVSLADMSRLFSGLMLAETNG